MKKERILIVIVLAAAFLVHASFINNGFTWLDHGDIEAGRAVLPISKLPYAFFNRFGETNFYRPLVTILNSLDAFFYGNSPQGYHLTNILLQVIVTLASFFFALSFFELSFVESSIVALMVGVHPLSILPVGAISYRQELLVVIFTFTTVVAYIRAQQTGKIIWKAGSLFFFWLALISKETALFWVPALIFLWERGKNFKKLRHNLQYIIAFFLLAIIYGVFRLRAIPEIWSTKIQNLSFSQALATRLSVFTVRLIDIINPARPNFSDATLITDMTVWKPWLAIFLLLAGVFIIYRKGKKSTVSKLLFFILITLLPSLSILPLPRFSSPHYSYIAAPAAGVAAILIGRKVMNSFGSAGKAIFILLITIWISGMTASTYTAGFLFKNDLTLFSHEVKRDDNFREGHFYLGDYYLRQRNFKQAVRHLEASLSEDARAIAFVDRPAAMVNLAGAYLSLQKIAEAEKLLIEVIRKSSGSNYLQASYNLAVIAERKGDYRKVVGLLGGEINQWRQPEPLLLFVKGLIKTGKEDEADNILENRMYINDDKKRQEIIQTFRQ